MRFYDLLVIERGRIDLSAYFSAGDQLVFSFDLEDEMFEAELVSGSTSYKSTAELCGFVSSVGVDGSVEVPWWVLETAGAVKAFLVSPVYSYSLEKHTAVYLSPMDEVEKPKKKVAPRRDVTQFATSAAARKEVDLRDLSKDMLGSAFGDDFDTSVGTPKVAR